jgi:uncharacterized protein (TIGR04255 family)
MSSSFPEFELPPVVEVAISLQFKPLDLLRTPHLGLLWEGFRREGYSRIEDHGELEPTYEEFGTKPAPRVGVRIQTFDDAPPLPRVWFLNEAQNELIQVQRDRLIVNWRQGAQATKYPRYVNIIKRFRSSLAILTQFAVAEKLGSIAPTQCEVTYVNHMPSGLGWSTHAELDQVVTTWGNRYSDDYLDIPEDVGFTIRYKMNDQQGNPLGRLHVAFQSAYRTTDGLPIFVMNMTARGKPAPADLDGVFRLFDREHEWIVRGFASITTTHMHDLWRRKHGS